MNKLLLSFINIFGYFFGKVLNFIDLIFRKKVSLFLKLAINNYLNLTIKNEGIFFDATEKNNYYRGRDLMIREPDTLYWIREFMKPDEIFYDIGANIGTYSLYAAKKKNLNVIAIEPESSSYYYLNKNIFLNNLDNKITALNIALNDKDKLSYLRLIKFEVAGTEINFDEKLDHKRREFKPIFNQGVFGYSMDSLVEKYGLPTPNHIKIDVGGDDLKIFNGMQKILKSNEIKTVMIELDVETPERYGIIEKMNNLNFKLITDNPKLRNSEYEKTKIFNHFFIKNDTNSK